MHQQVTHIFFKISLSLDHKSGLRTSENDEISGETDKSTPINLQHSRAKGHPKRTQTSVSVVL